MIGDPVMVVPPSVDPEAFRVMAKIMGYTDKWIDECIARDKAFAKEINKMNPHKVKTWV